MIEPLIEGLVRLVIYLCRLIAASVHSWRSMRWPRVEATITESPESQDGIFSKQVEFAYSYRIDGELYTGLHEQPLFLSDSDYAKRFVKGRRFVVRVKPGAPEVSMVWDRDQADCIEEATSRT